MRTLLAALILLQSANANSTLLKTQDGGQTWQVVLNGGAYNVNAITVDPTNSQVLYLGTNQGHLLKTTDGGTDWSDGTSATVYCGVESIDLLLVDPSSSQTLYASASGECQEPFSPPFAVYPLLKSTNGGTSWTPPANSIPTYYPIKVALDPRSPKSLFAATAEGLFQSADGAATWSRTGLISKGPGTYYPVDCVAVDPSNSGTIYACAQGQLMKSTDRGVTWAATTAAMGSGPRAFAIDPQHGNLLYVFLAYGSSGVSGIFASQDGGATWTPGTLPGQLTQIRSLLVDPVVSSRIWASSDRGLLVSNDSGASWGTAPGPFPPESPTALGADPTGAVYVATNGPLPALQVDHINSAAGSSIQIAPGEIASVYGEGLASGTASYSGTSPVSRTLLDASAGVQNFGAPLFYVSGGQINLQIPFEAPIGNDLLSIASSASQGVRISVPIQIVPAAPAIFTLNMQGTGAGAIEHGLTYALVTDLNPATPGEIITIYCTGLGAVKPSVQTGDEPGAAAQTVIPVQVSIAGTPAEVFYAGVTPGFAGLYQINAEVPPGTASGAQPVVVTQNGISSNTATVAIQ